MGFFKKVFKKVKNGFKKIGKGIKSAFKKFGKFMGKIGIIGQLALMFTPVGAMMGNLFAGVGNAAGNMLGKVIGETAIKGVAGSGAGLLGSGNVVARGAGKMLQAGANFAKAGHSAFKTITDGISSFVGEFTKTAIKKIPGINNFPGIDKMMPNLNSASDTFFTGENSAWSTVQKEFTANKNIMMSSFDDVIQGKMPTATQQTGLSSKSTNASTGSTSDFKLPAADETFSFNDVNKSMTDLAADKSLLTPDGFNKKAYDNAIKGGFDNIQDIDASGFNRTAMEKGINKGTDLLIDQASEKDLLSKVSSFGAELYDRGVDAVTSIPGKILETPGKFVDDLGDRVVGGLETKAMQKIGLADKAVGTEVFYGAVANFDMAPAGSYGSAEINDRAMQIQLSGTDFYNQAPYGAGAHFYTQNMARGIGGTA